MCAMPDSQHSAKVLDNGVPVPMKESYPNDTFVISALPPTIIIQLVSCMPVAGFFNGLKDARLQYRSDNGGAKCMFMAMAMELLSS